MSKATDLLVTAEAVLLDFDGPVTPLMPKPANIETADACRAALERHGIQPPIEIATTSDHLAVIRWVGAHTREALTEVEKACIAAEVKAAKACIPTLGAHEFIATLSRHSVPVVVVSNNAAEAIHAYLDRHQLAGPVRDVVGRPVGHPELMKPNTYLVDKALRILGTAPEAAVMIGDSVSDVEVAHKAGARSIGYAKNPKRGDELADAGADALISTMTELAEAWPE
ncbi:HAD family hydrolase [Myceligenerans halotolerans]